jgi:hypothetical protein
MSEEAVIADRQAEAGEEPHAKKQADLDSPDRAIEQQAQCDERAEKGQYIEDNKVTPLQPVKVAASDYSIVAHFPAADSHVKRYHCVAARCKAVFPGCANPDRRDRNLRHDVLDLMRPIVYEVRQTAWRRPSLAANDAVNPNPAYSHVPRSSQHRQTPRPEMVRAGRRTRFRSRQAAMAIETDLPSPGRRR